MLVNEKLIVKKNNKVLIVSDLHLGLGDIVNSKLLFDRLKAESINFDKVILNGDILETWKYGSLGVTTDYRKSKVKKIFKSIPGLEEFLRSDKVHVILGNHYYTLIKFGFNNKSITLFKDGAMTYITHGNDCDGKTSFEYIKKQSSWWVVAGAWLSSKVSEVFNFFKWSTIKDSEADINKLFYSYNNEEDKILKYANYLSRKLKPYGYKRIILGHTHHQERKRLTNYMWYTNTGSYSLEHYNRVIL